MLVHVKMWIKTRPISTTLTTTIKIYLSYLKVIQKTINLAVLLDE